MTNTERKLNEAKYFLDQLNPNYPYFDYILSAYLNAARSTTWIMRHEFNNIAGWENWFKSCKLSKKESNLLKKINELRILSTKKTGIKTDFYFMDCLIPGEEYYPTIDKMLKKIEGQEVEITISPEDEKDDVLLDKEDYKIKGVVKLDKDESRLSIEAIQELCNDYFGFLKTQVNSCVEKFKNTV